ADDPPEADSGANPEKHFIIQCYQDHLSAADGNRCPMTPSCSEYAARAIEKHGPVIGWIMASDRLVRCGRDEVKLSPKVISNGQTFVSDPVSANDFWWFQKEEAEEAE
ncbi:MAG: membrane protein insertion efficiency factor YidD, partial [Desulfobacterales bacterium]|nr:membrane protein insertion efficiency factor YidD [Desulfobacterales bacterium]